MRTAGLLKNDVWAGRVLREHGVVAQEYEDVEAEVSVLMDEVELRHRGSEEKYRPYLHLTGYVTSIVPDEGTTLPWGVDTITYEGSEGGQVDAFYEFDDDQLVNLVSQGYFTRDFDVPRQIKGIPYELPARVDVMVVDPVLDERGVPTPDSQPLVFTQVHDSGKIEITRDNSGYELDEYFENYLDRAPDREEEVEQEVSYRSRSDELDPLFEDEDEIAFEDDDDGKMDRREKDSPVEVTDETTAGDIQAQLARAEAEVAAEREAYRQEQVQKEGTQENLYQQRVASVLEARTVVPSDEVDWVQEAEAEEERTRSQARRAEQIRQAVHEESEDLDLDAGDEAYPGN